MSERATPETDAATMPWYGERDAVVGDFARNLERERNEALQLARELRDAMKAIKPFIGYPSTPTQMVYQFVNSLKKATEVLP